MHSNRAVVDMVKIWCCHQGALFLAKITRPIYNVVFEASPIHQPELYCVSCLKIFGILTTCWIDQEWYVKVDVDPKNQRDKKVGRLRN